MTNDDLDMLGSTEDTSIPRSTTDTLDTTASTAAGSGLSRTNAALSGILSAGLALGTGEVLSGLTERIPSLIVRVGDGVIENVPGSIEQWAIDTLGTNDKPALVIGIVVISLIIGAFAGIAAARNFRAAFVVYGVFGLIGGLAAASDPQRGAGWGWFVAAAGAAVGLGSLWYLLRSARAGVTTSAAEPAAGRRTFVSAAAAAAAVGVAAPVIGSALRGRQTAAVEGDREDVAAVLDSIETPTPEPQATAAPPQIGADLDNIEGISTLVTPNDGFYRIDSALTLPTIDVDTWSMKITGMVDNEIELTFDDLLAMDPVEEYVTLSCVSNRVGGELVGNARWLGVPLKKLLDMAGVQAGATQIVGRSVDGWTGGFPTDYLDDPNRVALVAVAMNGEPLPVRHGFPVRLVIAGLYGYVSATKWLKEIELTTLEDFDGYWITRGWSKLGPIKTQSRIDVPRSNTEIAVGAQSIAGVAWAPDRGIDSVEVQVAEVLDGEELPASEWMQAELSDDVTNNSWRQWAVTWDAPAGDHIIRVRATDSNGDTQTDERTDVAPDGATGWHTIIVRALP